MKTPLKSQTSESEVEQAGRPRKNILMKPSVSAAFCCLLAILLAGCAPGRRQGSASAAESFYTPADPPSSRYVIDARIGDGGNAIEGRETVSLKNSGRDPLGVVAFDWSVGSFSPLEVSAAGRKLFPPDSPSAASQQRPIFIHLPEPLAPGRIIEMNVTFSRKTNASQARTEFSSSNWYPRLW